MQQARDAEGFHIGPKASAEIAHHQFHGARMDPQFFRRRPIAKQLPGFIAGDLHRVSLLKNCNHR
jgi:hypothetical protein